MVKKITEIRRPKTEAPKLLRVAAYARVSSGKQAMLHSLSAQVSYYNDLIQRHPGWVFCGVYADEALTGTKDSRQNFQRLLADCKAGRVDMVITKSISRFARNTVTLLQTVRELKALNVDVYFEEQNIHSLSADGELILTILASYAQEESLSASENQKWRIKRNFENGIPCTQKMLGYRLENGVYEIVPEEAELVKGIFADYLSGMGMGAICKKLNETNIASPTGGEWHPSVVAKILSNYTYTGNLLLQKTFRENHITKKTLLNRGELPQYHVADTHEPIIPIEVFTAVQAERKRRVKKHAHPQPSVAYPLTGLVTCGNCGRHYRRKVTHTGPVWICSTYNTKGKAYCASKQIPEGTLLALCDELGGIDKITAIRAENGNTLIFTLTSGETTVKRWQDRSRSESWTKEMKEAARQKTIERNKKKCRQEM